MAGVLGEGDVADVMDAVFDGFPVAADVGGEVGRSGLPRGQVGDAVADLLAVAYVVQAAAVAQDTEDLSGMREIDAVGQGRAKDTVLGAAVSAVGLAVGDGGEVGVGAGQCGNGGGVQGGRGVSRAARCPRWGRLRAASPRTGRASFPASGSPVVLLRDRLLVVDGGMTAGADDQGLPSTGPHGLYPFRCGRGAVSVEVGDSLDVVDGDPVARVA